MTETAPSLNQWRQLYALAAQIKDLAPWEWMEEIDVFGVQHPESGALNFAGVMGMAGQHYAVAVYLGVEALHDFIELHNHPPADSTERIMDIPQLQLSFESRDFLKSEDRRILKELGLRFRGADNWPLWRAYRPGFFPWFIDAEEARLLEGILEQLLDVAPRFGRNPQLLYPGGAHRFLVRVKVGDAWEDRRLHLPPPAPVQVDAQLDALSLARLQKLPPGSRVLEMALFRMWSPVREGKSRPFYPYVLLLVDAAGGQVLNFEMLTPVPTLEQMWRTVPTRVAQQLARLDSLPGAVHVAAPQLYAALRPVASALNLSLTQVSSLPHLDQARNALAQAASADFPAGLIPVDFGPGEAAGFGADLEGAEEERKGDFDFVDAVPRGDELDMLSQILRRADRTQLHPAARRPYRPVFGAQVIGENGPGTARRDFTCFLEAFGPEGVALTSSGRLPTARFMAQLNDRLARPLALDFRRPQPRSYPNAGGLYLLLRATGLGLVQEGGKRLILDERVRQSWESLNPTEQYFTLLESWLRRGRAEVLSEFASPYNTPLHQWLQFSGEIPDQGLQIAGNRRWEESLTYIPGLPALALMEIFGLLEIQHGRPLPGKGWNVEAVRRTPWGDALLARLLDYLATEWEISDEPVLFGRLQPVFQPFFPQWRANLQIPEAGFAEGLHLFKISLGRVWRRIAAPALNTLDQLAGAILSAFEFDSDHLYCFEVENRFGLQLQINHPAMEEPPFAEEVRIGELPLGPGDAMVFRYDFGDNWEFTVLLEEITAPDARRKKPVILEKQGKTPAQYRDWDE